MENPTLTQPSRHPRPQSLQTLLAELPANLLAGRKVLVTGAARGLGLAFAQVHRRRRWRAW